MNYALQMAETVMKRFPNPDTYPYRSWSYPQGFLLWGFIKLYEKTGRTEYRDYVLKYCDGHVDQNGNISGFTGESLDDIMAGSLLVWAYAETNEARYRLACDRIRRVFDDYPRNTNGGFWHGRALPGEMWVDGLFMGLMFLTRYGRHVGDARYCFEETVRQLNIVFACCEKDGSGLLYHAYSERPWVIWAHPVTGKSQEVWCEGLGWYAMILAEVLELLPEDQPGRESLVFQLEKLVRGLTKCQDPASGLWYQVVDKPRTMENWHDTSGSAMFAYAIEKAARLGYVQADCLKVAQKGFEGVKTKCVLDPDGNLNVFDACDGLGVQVDYPSYVHFSKNVNCKEAVAAVLWAATALEVFA